jgi:hypothetical protein
MTHHEQPRGSSDPKSEVLRKTYTVSKGPTIFKYPSAQSRRPPFVHQVASIVEAVGHKDADHERAFDGVPTVKGEEEEAKAARAKKEEAAKLRTGFDLMSSAHQVPAALERPTHSIALLPLQQQPQATKKLAGTTTTEVLFPL